MGISAKRILAVMISNLPMGELLAADALFDSFKGSQGCAIQQVTDGPFGQYQFQGVSPDGQWLSYSISETDDGPYHSVLLNLRTGEIEKLGPEFNNTGNFSGNNRTLIAAVFGKGGLTDIVELDLQTRSTTTLAADPAWDWLPSYSPDQQSIVFNSFRSGNSDLYLLDRASGQLQQLTDDPRYEAHGEFSPDGSRILFHRMIGKRDDGGYDFDLYTVNPETLELELVLQSPFEESYGSWAPAGQHIVFSSDFEKKPEQHNLYVKALDGDTLTKLTEGDWKDNYAFWTRDGKFIYFNSDRSGTTQVYRLAMDGAHCLLTAPPVPSTR